jgi:FlaA1/EpsC-like NDP-sugar epimerase
MTPAFPKPGVQSVRVFRMLIAGGAIALAGLSAFLLRFDFAIPRPYLPHASVALALWLAVKVAIFYLYDLDRSSYRFFSAEDAPRLAVANLIGSTISALLLFALFGGSFPRSVLILDLLLCSLTTGTAFLAGRLTSRSEASADQIDTRDVLIYGAGQAGVILLAELRANRKLGYKVRGFVDDDRALKGTYIQGIQVLGSGAELEYVTNRTGARDILIAAPSADSAQMLDMLQNCQRAGLRYRTVATLGEIIEGNGIASQLRDVDVQDLLCRTPVHLNHELIRERMQGKVVMVTGAAGSIGSELCRQIARFKPSALIAFEIAETPLFHLEREMRLSFPEVRFYAEIGSVQNPRRLSAVLEAHRPSVIFHAAAYKHVPLMEANVLDAIENNVLGTYNVLTAAEQFGVGEFVLISSDKAVRPSSVMGATKRLCELLILSLPAQNTRRMAVRFGNVLGSNGSVIPLFKEQIAAGGPVTITHPDMRRYFMTIPEATQLVLQAHAMGNGGEIFVLDMGEQVKIVDLAHKLIQLSGLVPNVDVNVVYTGTRPGEKLYEELNLDDEVHLPTPHKKIRRFAGNGVAPTKIVSQTRKLMRLCQAGDADGVMRVLLEMIPEYRPATRILPFPSFEREAPAAEPAKSANIRAPRSAEAHA